MMCRASFLSRWLITGLASVLLGGCAITADRSPDGAAPEEPATLTPMSSTYRDLINLPAPRGKVRASAYGFRDQTGQYKKTPNSTFSTAVTQGATSMLVKAMLDSGWFIPVEREGLQDLLTERKIIRAALKRQRGNQKNGNNQLPPLTSASVLLQGGIVAYESNVLSGGAGARYFGLGANDLYSKDQVTVSLRAVDIRTGRVLKTVLTTKTIYSYEIDASLTRFVSFRRLLEAEAGFTRNEPAQLCVLNAIEAAVIQLIVQGANDGIWQLAKPEDIDSPIVQTYLTEHVDQLTEAPTASSVFPVAANRADRAFPEGL